ncbi:MAG TPA: protein kinase [Gemmatimonadaceae bacterium]|jgi:Tol biopolymer transport system component/predicted Ser/Thr protein kinase
MLDGHMNLQPGVRLGPYEIVSALGKGGMGEVYKARDTRLGRAVAIKILAAEFAEDAKLKARFEREAKTISSLTHPHICTLFDVGENYLVMELCDGQTLAEQLRRGPLTLDQLLDYGIQISEALDKAHQSGIVHRDLKPTNVMITKTGVKLLDFGLAKQQDGIVTLSGTTTMKALTEESQIAGTLQYMAPETLTTGRVDPRSDIFALGLVLYEMATGKPAFNGLSKASAIAAILEHDPTPVAELCPDIPPGFERLIGSCLMKNPDARMGTAHDVGIALRWIRESRQDERSAVPQRSRWLSWSPMGMAVAIVIAMVILATRGHFGRAKTPEAPSMSFRQITDDTGLETMPALSPDGKSVAYVSARSGNEDIYLQRIGGRNALNLTPTSLANDSQPSFSRDGLMIAFRSDREGGGIFTMGATGESVKRVTDFGSHPSWSPDGRELVVSSAIFRNPRQRRTAAGELWIVEVNSGRKRRITSLIVDGDAVQPSWSPHGDRIAFWGRVYSHSRLFTISSHGGRPLAVLGDKSNDTNPVWSPDGKYLYFSSDRDGAMNLWRIAIDEPSGRVGGDPEPVKTPARNAWPVSVASDGRMIAYCAREFRSNIDRIAISPDGRLLEGPVAVLGRTIYMAGPEVSSDNNWLTFTADQDVYVARTNGRELRQLTDDQGIESLPSWSPDGKRITFGSNRSGKLEVWTIAADGSGLSQVTKHPEPVVYPKWSPDGSRITVRADHACKAGTCVIDARAPYPITPQGDTLPSYEPGWLVVNHEWSPDGKWLLGGAWVDEKQPTRIVVYSFEKRTYTTLLNPSPLFEAAARWMPDNRHVLFSDGRRINMIDRVTLKTRQVFDSGSVIDGFIAVTKDGRYVYYVRNSEESDIWLATVN